MSDKALTASTLSGFVIVPRTENKVTDNVAGDRRRL